MASKEINPEIQEFCNKYPEQTRKSAGLLGNLLDRGEVTALMSDPEKLEMKIYGLAINKKQLYGNGLILQDGGAQELSSEDRVAHIRGLFACLVEARKF